MWSARVRSGLRRVSPARRSQREVSNPGPRQAMANVASVLGEVGLGWPDVFKTTVYLTDISQYSAFNAVYVEELGSHRPARTLVAVAGLPIGAVVEIEAWALARS